MRRVIHVDDKNIYSQSSYHSNLSITIIANQRLVLPCIDDAKAALVLHNSLFELVPNKPDSKLRSATLKHRPSLTLTCTP